MPERDADVPQVSAGEAGMFLLELVGLTGLGRWGWALGTSTLWRFVLAGLFVSMASAAWTLFRTRGFVPSGREPVVAIPGPLRVAIEYAFYIAGAWGLWVSGWNIAAISFAAGVVIVTAALRDRLARLMATH